MSDRRLEGWELLNEEHDKHVAALRKLDADRLTSARALGAQVMKERIRTVIVELIAASSPTKPSAEACLRAIERMK